MSSRKENRYAAIVSLSGAAVWATVASLAGLHRIRIGIIELLFLFAPLVIVPLGTELACVLEFLPETPISFLMSVLQWFAAIAVCASLWIPPGRTAAILSLLWLVACVLRMCSRVIERPRAPYSLLSFLLDVAHFDLVLGASWFVVSRAGWRPMGFQEPIVLLTAVHFHYSGFATAVIAASTLSFARSRVSSGASLRGLIVLAVLLPFALAAGFVFWPFLRFAAAMALAIVITALAGIMFWGAREFRSTPARIYVRSAACAAFAAFTLATLYAIGDYFYREWITIPGMANSHGVLNGLGFVLLGLLGWLTELHAVDTSNGQDFRRRIGVYAHSREHRPTVHPATLPDFVARDLYDR
jgi:hypothetical protein